MTKSTADNQVSTTTPPTPVERKLRNAMAELATIHEIQEFMLGEAILPVADALDNNQMLPVLIAYATHLSASAGLRYEEGLEQNDFLYTLKESVNALAGVEARAKVDQGINYPPSVAMCCIDKAMEEAVAGATSSGIGNLNHLCQLLSTNLSLKSPRVHAG